jgi:hypothetical protein
MTIGRVVLLHGQGSARKVTSAGADEIPLREASGIDLLAECMAQYLTCPVAVIEDLGQVRADDFVVCPRDTLDALLVASNAPHHEAQRCLLVDEPLSSALAIAEQLRLAGVVDSRVQAQWKIGYARADVALFGRRELAGAKWWTESKREDDRSENYCRIMSGPGATLPELLGRYIEEYVMFLRGF